jgi:hypothetical protein
MKLRQTMFKAAARSAELPKELAAEADALYQEARRLAKAQMLLCMGHGR